MTDAGPLDILHDIPAGDGTRRTYEQLVERGADYQLAGLRVRVAALDDIIASKDHAALPELRSLTARGTDSSLEPEHGSTRRGDPEPPGLDLGL